jgi:hypothetical protein
MSCFKIHTFSVLSDEVENHNFHQNNGNSIFHIYVEQKSFRVTYHSITVLLTFNLTELSQIVMELQLSPGITLVKRSTEPRILLLTKR